MLDETDIEVEKTEPLEVKVTNKKDKTPYDELDAPEYDEMRITDEEIKEAEDGNPPT